MSNLRNRNFSASMLNHVNSKNYLRAFPLKAFLCTIRIPLHMLLQIAPDQFWIHTTNMVLTYAGAAVICYYKAIRAVTSTTLRRRVAEKLAAQGRAPLQA